MNRKVAKRVYSRLVLSASVLEMVLIFLIIFWYVRRHLPIETSLCFHDDAWLKYGSTKSELFKHLTFEYRNSTNGKHYCVKAVHVMKNIANKQIDRRYDTEMNPEPPLFNLTIMNCSISDKKPSFFNLTNIKTIDAAGTENTSIVFWKTSMNERYGFKYLDREGMITIQKSGFYHISTQLTIMTKNNSTAFIHGDILNYWVMRISDKTKQDSILLESANSPCQMPVKQYEQSISMAAAFSLEENDRIYVAVPEPFQVVPKNGQHFFSVYEI